MTKKESCSDCFNRDNEHTEAQFLVLNPPTYPRDVHLCRHHLVVMLDAFMNYSTVTKEITIIKLDVVTYPRGGTK